MTVRSAIPRLLLALVITATAFWLALNRERLDPAMLEAAIRDLGLLAPVAHIVLFALGTVLFLPGTLFGLAGGVLFATSPSAVCRRAWMICRLPHRQALSQSGRLAP